MSDPSSRVTKEEDTSQLKKDDNEAHVTILRKSSTCGQNHTDILYLRYLISYF